uniref:Uncharacterized protein n=1 Tax=Glossina pallidipes TaxID=7398 RepID=A0A1A9ZXB9_GLOPL
MWKKLEISDEKFFINCALTDDEKMICILFSLNKCWFATLTDDEIKQKVELLNKRMEYNKFVKNTLLNSDLAEASIEELAQTNISDGVINKRLLKLKYRIEELPFKFEWFLTQACTEERNFFVPMLLAIDDYKQQVQELKSIIQKKDEEIKQYRGEGFTLRRTTAITRPFDADEFNNKRKNHKCINNFEDLSKCVLALQLSNAVSMYYTRVEELKRNFEMKLPKELPKATELNYEKIEEKSKIEEIISLFDAKISKIARGKKGEITKFGTLINGHSSEREPQPKPLLFKPIRKIDYNVLHNDKRIISKCARKQPVVKYAKSLNNSNEKSQLQHSLSEQDFSQLSVKNKILLYTKFIEDMLKVNANYAYKNVENCHQEKVSQESVKRLVEEYEKRCRLTEYDFSTKNQTQLIEKLDEIDARSWRKGSVEVGEVIESLTTAKNLRITVNIKKFPKDAEQNYDCKSPSTSVADVNVDNMKDDTHSRKQCSADMCNTLPNEDNTSHMPQGNGILLRNQAWKELFHNWLKDQDRSFFNTNFLEDASEFSPSDNNASESFMVSQKYAFDKYVEGAVEKLKNDCSKEKPIVCVDERKKDLKDITFISKAKRIEIESDLAKNTSDDSQNEHHNAGSLYLTKDDFELTSPETTLSGKKESYHARTRTKESSDCCSDSDSDFESSTSNESEKLFAESKDAKRKLFAENKNDSNDVVFVSKSIGGQKHFICEADSLHKLESAHAVTSRNLTSTPNSEGEMTDTENVITPATRYSRLEHLFVENVSKISGFIKEKLTDCSLIGSQAVKGTKANSSRPPIVCSEITFNSSPIQHDLSRHSINQTSSPDKLAEYRSNLSTSKISRKCQDKQQNFISSVRFPLKNIQTSLHESEPWLQESSGVQAIQGNQPSKHCDVWSTLPRNSSISEQQFSDENAKKTSTFWIKSGDFLLTLGIYYVESEKLRCHYDMLCQESGKNQIVHFGIDNYKFSAHETIQNESRLSLPKLSSHYWFATDNIAIPFSGKPLNDIKIKRIFGFVSASVLETGLLRFGVDHVDFSKIPEFVLDTQPLSLESNWSQLIGLQTGYSNGLEGRDQFAWPSTKFNLEEHGNAERDELSFRFNGNNSVLSDLNDEPSSMHSNCDAMLDADSQYCSDSLENAFQRIEIT